MSKKNAPAAAATADEGEDRNTYEGETINMNTTATHPHVAELFDEIAAARGRGQHLTLTDGDPFFVDIPAVKVRAASDLAAPAEEIRVGISTHWFATIIGADGETIKHLPPEWWRDHTGELSAAQWETLCSHENAIARLGDFLVISHGEYTAATKIGDGEAVSFEFVTSREERRRRRAQLDLVLAEYPQLSAAKPAWAETVAAEDADEDGVSVTYERSFGLVGLQRSAEFDFASGTLRWYDDTTAPEMCIRVREGLADADVMRRLAVDLAAAAEYLEGLADVAVGSEVRS